MSNPTATLGDKAAGDSRLGQRGATDEPRCSDAPVADWIALLKPRVMALVVFTGFVGLLIAPGHLHPVLAFAAVLCIAVAAGAAGAINMWYDRDIDALMRRTRRRPIPAGRIAPGEALGFGVTLAVASVLLMWLATNEMAALALACSIAFYVFVYTMWLKRRTPQNIVIGGAAGAFPPVVGWVAVTGSVDLAPLILFAIVFFWTPPHFWSLSLFASGDYERAGVPMLPVVAGAKETRRQIVLYTLLLVPVSLVPWAMGFSGEVYLWAALALGIGFLVSSVRVLRDQQDSAGRSLSRDAPAKAAFNFSIIYLFVLFAALAVDHLVR
ncbi:MAG: protoheme IX farnesyltransferase [Acetobacteraceae bacterium]|nr:protoheme IX farnesyltransferase [Acetobacteraceae bacterium]